MSAYSFLDVFATLTGPGGVVILGSSSGVADEGINVSMNENKNTLTTSADGDAMHSLHASKAGRITVRLLKTSKTNRLLSLMYNLQTASSSLHGQNVLLITDKSRGDVEAASKVAFAKFPDNLYAKEGNIVEWDFDAGVIDRFLNGSF